MVSLTPDTSRKVGQGMAPSPIPFLTPRPERRRLESRCSDLGLSRHNNRDQEINVQVILRCRPLNEDEQRVNVPRVVTCNEHRREVNIIQSVANKQVDRVFTFDKVFGPKAQQRSIYDQAITPIVNEVLEGFNCTIFAYGQTGTGKTYTMEGGMRKKGGELAAEAGVIPRAVRQIFDVLEAQNADYNMKVTFLELYNEEITDLLALDDSSKPLEDRQRKPISLMEDGKGSVIVRGLEEEAVYSANEIHNLLERGAAKRRTADTLLNKRSSRSHSVFTITVHIKETTIGDEELIKCGKLNLVDLAGSENISRSGAREARAREAGEINKSLLTLGRVINTLVEHSAHVPYRDSKLTRLLRDSLGGKTKTCIIATISPSAHCLEETLSTLDYAYRAKNIKNKPEANQKMSKAVLLKDLYLEMDRMKQDVRAARERNGVYIPHERFAADEAEKKARNEKIEQLESDLNASEKQVEMFRELYVTEQEEKLDIQSELKDCKMDLENTNMKLKDLQEKHREAISTLKQKESAITKLIQSENFLIERAKELRGNLQIASNDISTLFEKIDHKDSLESKNQGLLLEFGSKLDQSLKDLHKTILGSIFEQQQQLKTADEHVSTFLASKHDATEILESRVQKMLQTYITGTSTLKELAHLLQTKSCSDLQTMKSTMTCQITELEKFLDNAVSDGKLVAADIQNSITEQKEILAYSSRQQEEGLHRSMVSAETISRLTEDLFNEITHHASELVRAIRDSQIDQCHKLALFQETFKEEAVHEEKQAMEKIAAILTSLTAKKTGMVSEASRKIQESTVDSNAKLLQEISNMQNISTRSNNELNLQHDKLRSWYLEDTFSLAETKTTIENSLQECTNKVDYSRQHWESVTELSINHMNERIMTKIESFVEETNIANNILHDEITSTSSSLDAEIHTRISDISSAANDSLMLDKESMKEVNNISNMCVNTLNCIGKKHKEVVAEIRNQTEQCLKRDYLVDQIENVIPRKREIVIPSLASIEEMRTRSFPIHNQAKVIADDVNVVANRAPFADVN
ncbi:kinesin-like protein KIN-5B [Impatiens glandulifera]|uniref:kinesin-like protein KIN-5B n=1 Tax=Impatiens glandulifera TaxID=253017 RepID=UPI001FB0600A|nr:kinesin-like protein KIN-5B [Impatiens glandulifera]